MALAMQDVKALIDKLDKENALSLDEWEELIRGRCDQVAEYAAEIARQRSKEIFGNRIYTRGLIEISNYCKNNCYYCGIRRDNRQVERYRLSREDILSCADIGEELGFRTFVLQGGEDAYYTDQVMCDLIREIKERHPNCAITLSLGERSEESYRLMREAGADRYLLRHETADKDHYKSLHPQEMDFDHRIQCLYTLKDLGYQVGCGFMVGSRGQTPHTLAEDMVFIQNLQPAMVGIGPFVPHHETPLKDQAQGTVEETLYLISLLRLLQPKLLLPATTAIRAGVKRGSWREPMSSCQICRRLACANSMSCMIIRSAPGMRLRSAGAVWETVCSL